MIRIGIARTLSEKKNAQSARLLFGQIKEVQRVLTRIGKGMLPINIIAQ